MATTNTTTTRKPTKRDRFNELLTIVPADKTDLIDFINHELELLDKKNSGEKKPTKTQQDAVAFDNMVAEAMTGMTEALTVGDIQKRDERISTGANVSNQKVSAALHRLEAEGRVVKTKVGRKSLFKLAD